MPFPIKPRPKYGEHWMFTYAGNLTTNTTNVTVDLPPGMWYAAAGISSAVNNEALKIVAYPFADAAQNETATASFIFSETGGSGGTDIAMAVTSTTRQQQGYFTPFTGAAVVASPILSTHGLYFTITNTSTAGSTGTYEINFVATEA